MTPTSFVHEWSYGKKVLRRKVESLSRCVGGYFCIGSLRCLLKWIEWNPFITRNEIKNNSFSVVLLLSFLKQNFYERSNFNKKIGIRIPMSFFELCYVHLFDFVVLPRSWESIHLAYSWTAGADNILISIEYENCSECKVHAIIE